MNSVKKERKKRKGNDIKEDAGTDELPLAKIGGIFLQCAVAAGRRSTCYIQIT
jgi:hypothetical protein